MKGKQVLITGGNGFLGSNLAKRLSSEGADVTVICRNKMYINNSNKYGEDIIFEEIEINEKTIFKELIEGKDIIFHFAWQTDLGDSMKFPEKDIKNDILGLIRLLEDCKEYNPGVKIIFPSTVTVMGLGDGRPTSVYDINKLMAENLLYMYHKNYGLNFTCLRLANVFGEGQKIDNPKRGVLNFMMGLSLQGKNLTVYGDGKSIRDYSYVKNFMDAFILAAESGKTNGKTYILGSGIGKTFNEAVGEIKRLANEIYGNKVEIKHIPFPEGTNPINHRDFVADISEFKKDTGWTPKISFEDGLKKTMEFYNE